MAAFIFTLSSKHGLFDSLEYSVKKIFRFTKDSYLDFVQNKKRPSIHWWQLFIALIFILLSIILAIF